MVRLGLNLKPLPSSLHLPPLCASVLHITVAVLFAVAAISVVLNIKLNRSRYCYWFVVMVWIIFVNMHASLPFINICLTHPPLNSWFSFLFAMRCTEMQSNTSLHNLYPPFCSQFKPEEKTGSSFSVHICKPFAIFGCLLIAFSASNSRPPSFSILSQRCHQSSHCFHFSYDFQTNSLNQIAEFCVHACPVFTLMPFAAWLLFNTFCSCLSWFCSFFFFFFFTQCTQSTKDVLERVVHSSDFPVLCSPGTPKTTPQVLNVSSRAAPTSEPSPSVGCTQQQARQPAATACPPFSRSNKRDSLHSINPAFRLASPSPTLSHTTLILGDAPDTGFNPLHWADLSGCAAHRWSGYNLFRCGGHDACCDLFRQDVIVRSCGLSCTTSVTLYVSFRI